MLRDLWRLLLDNPIVPILLVTWLLSLIGKAAQVASQQAKKAAERELQRRRAEPREVTALPSMQTPPPVPRARPAAQAPRQSPRAQARPQPRQLSTEEAVAEMRRILAGEPPAPPPEQRRVPLRDQRRLGEPEKPPEPLREQSRLGEPEKPPEPLRPRRLGQFETQVDPRVGEGVQRRRVPASGQVGHSELGALGGRTIARRGPGEAHYALIDLSDLKRAIVLREVFGPPIALREGWGEPGGAGRVS